MCWKKRKRHGVEEKFGEQNFRVLTLAPGAVALAKNKSVGYVALIFGCHR